MKTTSVTYEIRLTLGQYQHETLSATVEAEIGENVEGSELMREARKVCNANSTKELKKKEKK